MIVSNEPGKPNDNEQLFGDASQIGEALKAWSDEGVDEVVCAMQPASVEMVERILEGASRAH